MMAKSAILKGDLNHSAVDVTAFSAQVRRTLRTCRPIGEHQLWIRPAQEASVIGRPVEPIAPFLALQDDWHPIVHVRDVGAGLGHHHRIAAHSSVSRQTPSTAITGSSGSANQVRILALISPSAFANSVTGITQRRSAKLKRHIKRSSLSARAVVDWSGLECLAVLAVNRERQ